MGRLNSLSVLTLAVNLVSDSGALIIYSKNQPDITNGLRVVIFASVSLVFGVIVSLCLLHHLFRRGLNDGVAFYKGLETNLESFPQLAIAIYVLSGSFKKWSVQRILLYFSASISFLSICVAIAACFNRKKQRGRRNSERENLI